MPGSFQYRLLRTRFALGSGSDGQGPGRALQIDQLRTSVRAILAGGSSMGECQIQIWGMTLDQMNDLSTLGTAIQLVRRNFVKVFATDEGKPYSQVFEGTITYAFADLEAAPEAVFNVIAHAGLYEQMAPVAPSSYPVTTDVAVIMKDLADKMGLTFENGGVSGVTLPSSYFAGTAREQAARAANNAGIDWIIDNGALSIWPRNGTRPGSAVTITPTSGLVGYPRFTANGVNIRVLYNRAIRFGSQLTLKGSIIKPANRDWKVVTLSHALDANFPRGLWFTDLTMVDPKFVVVAGGR